MDNYIYESHVRASGTSPFIFHYDILAKDMHMSDVPTGLDYLHYPSGRCICNWHENIEILYIDKGSGTLVSGSDEFSFSEGDTVIINSLELHYIKADEPLFYYVLIPDRAFLLSNGLDSSLLALSHVNRSDEAARLLAEFIKAYRTESEFSEAKIKAALLTYVLFLAEAFPSEGKSAVRSKSLSRIKLLIGYINTHADCRITADKAAEIAATSKYHLLREFKKITGMTLVNFTNNLRCEKARELLASGSLSVAEVGSLCGFETPSYFTKTFRAFAGMTPSEYRAKCRR